ncbi:MAG: peptidoglycan glycosyltransferase [Ruminococcus sp.]|nr:peptidoglycan glycosyltransferase [Ruminococcus sp.]
MQFCVKRLIAACISAAALTALFSCSSDMSGSNSLGGLDMSGGNNGVVGNDKIYDETMPSAATTAAAVTASETTSVPADTTAPTADIKGDICDVRGNILVYSNYEGDTGARHYNSGYKVSFANILDPLSAGLDAVLDEQLRVSNPTPVQGRDNVGRSVRLTFEGDVQNAVFEYMQSNNLVGSVVVMRTDGSLMAEVSYPSYDPELYRNDENYASSIHSGAFCNKAFQNAAPGSCFKIMSAVISEKNGITSLYDEGSWTDDGSTVHNWNWDTESYLYPMERSLVSAIIDSSNVFFAKSFQQIGTETVLSDLKSIFSFGNDCPVECDFGPLENYIEIYCNDDLRRSAFGQAYVRTCPLYLAALGREAVFGDMVKPFAVKSYGDTNDITSNEKDGSKPYDKIASIPREYRSPLLEGMKGVADKFGFASPAGYTLYAKTGTAETGAGDFLYITGCLKNDNDNSDSEPEFSDYSDYKNNGSYIIVMQIQNPQEHGFSFASDSAMFYKGIIDIVVSY